LSALNTVLLILHLFVTILLIGVVLIQRSEGGGLGIGTSQGMGSFMSGRGTANLLTRTTAILAAIFMALSMALAVLNKGGGATRSILDTVPVTAPAPASGGHAPAAPGANAPAAPAGNAPAGNAPAAGTPAAPAANTPASAAPGAATPPAAPEPAAKAPAPAAPSGPSAPTN
jgi:preprotein translocase subunit SecG